MKKILGIFLISISVITTCNIIYAKPAKTKFCAFPYAPFIITDQHKQITNGFDIDLAKELCKEMGTTCEFIQQPTRITLTKQLNSGECDAWIAGFTITALRKKDMDFTIPYYPSVVSYIADQNTTFTSSIEDFKNKKIAVVEGSNFVPYLIKTYGNNITMVLFDDDLEAMKALKNKQVDAVISDTPFLVYWKKQQDNKNYRLIETLAINKDLSFGEGYGIPIKKGNIKFQTALNQALTKVMKSDIYAKLVKEYLIEK